MVALLLFWTDDGLLGNEWLASAVGIAITYIVFVMGIPSLIFQTFIPEALRNIFNERFNREWSFFFIRQLIIAIILFLISNSQIHEDITSNIAVYCGNKPNYVVIGIACLVVFFIVFLLIDGYSHLIRNFKSTSKIVHRISVTIADNAINTFDKTGKINQKDFEDLNVLSRELNSGQDKTHFLEQCERIIEHLIDSDTNGQKDKLIKRLLRDAVCNSITYDGAMSNEENRRKVLEILTLVNGHTPRKPKVQEKTTGILNYFNEPPQASHHSSAPLLKPENNYDKTTIGYLTKEVGIAAMEKNDINSALEAIELLYVIQADPKELFAIGNKALEINNTQIVVSAFQKLRSEVLKALQSPVKPGIKDMRTLYCWLGIFAKLYEKNGASQQFAIIQWHTIAPYLAQQFGQLTDLSAGAYQHFFKITDFVTADAIKLLELDFFNKPN